ncbi:MAG: shikimate dehydrogenase [Pseudomonadota bacterium]
MTIKLGVIGHPIGHSKSPAIHDYWIEKYGLNATYEALDVRPDNLQTKLRRMIDQGYSGFNLTIPHKELVLELCDQVDDIAKVIGAVNTIYLKDNKIYGTNTDAFGFIENIKQNAPDFDFKAGKAVVLGAGGAAKAIVHGLLRELTPEIYVLNRTRAKAENLTNIHSECVIAQDWDERSEALDGTNLLINTTSLGMRGQQPLDIDLSLLPEAALVTDIVYAPLITPLLQDADQRGHNIVTGIGMLLHQARPAFQSWFDIMPEVDDELINRVLA